MRNETQTPIDQRYLWIEGRVSPSVTKKLAHVIPSTRSPNTVFAFVGPAYADLPLTKRFDAVYPRDRPQDAVRCECRIIRAIQQFGEPFEAIPHGWKSICVLQFSGGTPEIVEELPVVDDWYQNEDWICMCDEVTLLHLQKFGLPS